MCDDKDEFHIDGVMPSTIRKRAQTLMHSTIGKKERKKKNKKCLTHGVLDDIISPEHEEEDEPTDGDSRGLFCDIIEIDFIHVIYGCIPKGLFCVFCVLCLFLRFVLVFVTLRMSFTLIMWCLQQYANERMDL